MAFGFLGLGLIGFGVESFWVFGFLGLGIRLSGLGFGVEA